MPEAAAKRNSASPGSGNKQGAFKDKDKPTEIRMSNITAAKGINCRMLSTVMFFLSPPSVTSIDGLFYSCFGCHTYKSWSKRNGQNGRFIDVDEAFHFSLIIVLYTNYT